MSKEQTKAVVLKMLENSGKTAYGKPKKKVMSKAMIDVGFSESYSKNPQALRNTKTFQKLMDERLSDDMITQKHNELANASQLSSYEFPRLSKTDDRDLDEKTKKKGAKTTRVKLKDLTNEEVRQIIESVPGCSLIFIKRDRYKIIAFFSQPDSRSRLSAIDMAYKLKGNYAPEKHEVTKRKYSSLSNADLMDKQNKLKKFLTKK